MRPYMKFGRFSMEIKVPSVGESVFEATVARWHRQDGEHVHKDDLLCELETDKITLELNADAAGTLSIGAPAGTTVAVGAVIGTIAEEGEGPRETGAKAPKEAAAAPAPPPAAAPPARPAPAAPVPPLPTQVRSEEPVPYGAAPTAEERTRRQPMSRIRRRIAERLLAARQQTAMLTTFNEADLGQVLALRQKHGADFERRHGVRLGLMSFFVKACVEALREFPEVNARIDGDDIVFHDFYDIGIAIGAEKGLVVPVLRDADRQSFAAIEQAIRDFAERAAANRLDLSDLEGGTFSITNGGVYGSLLSTPILNPPQSAILGMHAIQERPVARDGEVVIRSMMYLALTYDHRLIDGRQAVQFLKRIKSCIEEPEELLLEL
jgi:2-oxoglutarate dehydrogenase E2 component (dihydrolipoamide succinyltransferase)